MRLQTEWLAADFELWVGASTACQAGETILASAANGSACRSSIKGGRGTGAAPGLRSRLALLACQSASPRCVGPAGSC